MNIHGPAVIPLPIRPEGSIDGSIAVSVDNEGFAVPLVPGKNFCGITVERRTTDDSSRSVPVEFEGLTQLRVEGLGPDSIGEKVYATGPTSFTLSTKGKASLIGKVLKREHDGRALVKFSV